MSEKSLGSGMSMRIPHRTAQTYTRRPTTSGLESFACARIPPTHFVFELSVARESEMPPFYICLSPQLDKAAIIAFLVRSRPWTAYRRHSRELNHLVQRV